MVAYPDKGIANSVIFCIFLAKITHMGDVRAEYESLELPCEY